MGGRTRETLSVMSGQCHAKASTSTAQARSAGNSNSVEVRRIASIISGGCRKLRRLPRDE